MSATTIKERPIALRPHEVRGVLDGRQTQLRRPIKNVPEGDGFHVEPGNDCLVIQTPGFDVSTMSRAVEEDYIECPYGKLGDRLWVRETWQCHDVDQAQDLLGRAGEPIYYKATASEFDLDSLRWKPSIHMPRWASRILLEIVNVRVERVQDISEGDAIAEGIVSRRISSGDPRTGLQTIYGLGSENDFAATATGAFELLWDSLYAKRGHGWEANPWTWVIEFRRIEP